MRPIETRLFSELAVNDRVYKIRNKVREDSHLCYNPFCPTSSIAIKSHVLQENGILSHAAEYNGNRLEVFEIGINNLNVRAKTGKRYQFKRASISKTNELSFWGFCSYCDNSIFAHIENDLPDYSIPKNQLLLAYRGLLNELNKKEYNIRFHLKVESENFPLKTKEDYKRTRIQHAAGMLMLQLWKARFEEQIFPPHTSVPFNYVHFKLPKIPVAASVILVDRPYSNVFTLPQLEAARPGTIKAGLPIISDLMPLGFLHLIPRADILEVSLVYSPEIRILCGIPVDQINELDDSSKLKFIGDMLITQGETWCISPSLHKQWADSKYDRRVLYAIEYYLPIIRKFGKINFNLFK